jgi:DNA-binding NtrC family response regulator
MRQHPTVLLIEDDPIALRVMTAILRNAYRVVPLSDPRQLSQVMSQHQVDVILLDLNLPYVSGENLLPMLVHDHPDVPQIVVTGTGDATTAVRLVKQGAFDYLVKPIEPKALQAAVARAMQFRTANQDHSDYRALRQSLTKPDVFEKFATVDRTMYRIFQYVETVGQSMNPVLITGETGTGKELIAHAIHACSSRGGEFVACNIGGLDDTLFTDTLFGHKKGSFTGATGERGGLVERAAGGTLFLDEIGDLPIASQVKLLRLLQEGEYMPVGSDQVHKADIRVIAATSLDLEGRIEDGRFRRDLFYRLNGHRIHLPPLRERVEDIPILISHFAEQSAKSLGLGHMKIPPAVLDLCNVYPFPGNIRELQALVHDAVSRSRLGHLSVEPFRRLTTAPQKSTNSLPPPQITFPSRLPSIDEVVEQLVTEALRRTSNNQAAAARLLNITRQAMSQRIKNRRQRELTKQLADEASGKK